MRNLIYPTQDYTARREQLRKLPVTWRDMSSSCAVPNWGEAICDEEYCIGDLTCAQVAYFSLKRHFGGLDLRWRKEEMPLLDHRPPKVFLYPVVGEIGYIDIKSAFLQFYQFLYLHSDYPYKRQKYPLYELAQEFKAMPGEKYKTARNAVVGICRSTQNKYVCQDKVWYTRKQNKFLSPTLWAQLMGILNQIGRQMIDYGAVFINCDGYAFLNLEGYYKAIEFLNERGILIGDSGIARGSINGINSVHIPGVKETKNNQRSGEVYHLETDDIDHLNFWLLNRKEFLK